MVHNQRLPDGKIRQDVLYAFVSRDVLRTTLEAGHWAEWKRTMTWRHDNVRWDWETIRSKLEDELGAWESNSAGAPSRHQGRVGTALADVAELLNRLTMGRRTDAVLIEALRPVLVKVHEATGRLLRPSSGPGATQEGMMEANRPANQEQAEELFDQGMECWWSGDRKAAGRFYRRALKLDEAHADSHNHLGIVALERRRLSDAATHFEAAIEGGSRHLVKERGRVEWGWTENRPFLRGLYNLALVRTEQRRHDEALEIQQDLLFRNPGDNQGVRWVMGETLHRLGRREEAIEAYRNAQEEPGCCFGLALALYESGEEGQAGVALLGGIAANQYIVPMLLGERWERQDVWHGSNMAEPEWAADCVQRYGDLWRKAAGSADFLRRWWTAEPVKAWCANLTDMMGQLDDLSPGAERSMLVRKLMGLKGEGMLSIVASEVDPSAGGLVFPMERPYPARPGEVSIRRQGTTAVIEYADPEVPVTHLQFKEGELDTMSDQDILSSHNEMLQAMHEHRKMQDYVAVEMTPGRPQIEYDPLTSQWTPVGSVVRCRIDDMESPVRILVDDRALSLDDFGRMLRMYSGWGMRIAFVPEDELDHEPLIRVLDEPEPA